MSSTSSKNVTYMRIFTYVLMIRLFVLPHTNANNFNKTLEAKALADWWGINASQHCPGYAEITCNEADHCTWYEITCNEAGSVVSIEFNCSQYCYEVPHDLGNLDFPSFPNLERFIIESGNLEESIPEQIGMLSNLAHLSLCGNNLNGKLPVSLTNPTKLVELDLSGNYFKSNFPSQIVKFIGPIPSSLGSMFNLTYVDLSWNNFIGPISSSLM
ncbi:MDIS1-interacting receptor like kinase 2-like protein [Tanacetum coccineum]